MGVFVPRDRVVVIWITCGLALACWAVFDTRAVARLLWPNRKRAFTQFELAIVRVPGVVTLVGVAALLLRALLPRR